MDLATITEMDTPNRAVVTGADSGIGRAVAVALAAAGCDVGITWHEDERGAEETAEEVRGLGRKAELAHLDLTRLPEAADAVDDLAERLGGLDVLVQCSGTGSSNGADMPSTDAAITGATSNAWNTASCPPSALLSASPVVKIS